jgi:hypothetical protein
MKKIIFILSLMIGLVANSQTSPWLPPVNSYQKIKGVWPFQQLKLPSDTVTIKEEGSFAQLNGVVYFKTATKWTAINVGTGILSFNGRTGVVTSNPDDYTISDITNLTDSLLARYTKTQSDARYKSISWFPTWSEVTGKPTNFATTFALSNDIQDSLNSKLSIRDTANLKAKLTQDLTAQLGSGGTIGGVGTGQTFTQGTQIENVLRNILIKTIPPTYTAPTAGIGSSPGQGSYEIGTNLGTITLSASFTQNNGGTSTGSTYSKYVSSWNNLGSNTDAITSLETTTYYRVLTSYNQGACLNNNLGTQDCTGRINAGSVYSGNIQFTPFFKRYWGFSSSQSPSNSTILALTQDNNGSTGSLSLSSITPSGSQFIVYFTKGTVTSVTVNGIPATGAFTITTYSVTNAQGYASTYSYVYSNTAQTSTIDSIIFN